MGGFGLFLYHQLSKMGLYHRMYWMIDILKKENVFLSTFSLDLNISPAELPLT